jgi:hypothetical protein
MHPSDKETGSSTSVNRFNPDKYDVSGISYQENT